MALSDAGPYAIPAAGVSGTSRTLWLLDRAAAAGIPTAITRIASP
jgi:6-phosphogluconolactonase